jgi:predicted ATPase
VLKNIHIQNFRCLLDVHAELRPLTVLIGPNDSGKSAFLDAIRVLGHAEQAFHLPREDHWRLAFDNHITLETDSGYAVQRLQGTKEGLYGWGTVDARVLQELFGAIRLFRLPSTGVAMLCEGYAENKDPNALQLNEDGSFVAAMLDFMLRKSRPRLFTLIEKLKELVPGFEDLDIATPKPQLRRVDLVIENGLAIPADCASAGVRLLLFFLTLAYHPSPAKIVLLEEPETGIHPRRLGEVMRLLRGISRGEFGGQAAQIILTTHSPYLLDHINIETDQILVFQRAEDGSRTAQPADSQRLKNFLDEFMLGEVWFNEEEDGLIAKPL